MSIVIFYFLSILRVFCWHVLRFLFFIIIKWFFYFVAYTSKTTFTFCFSNLISTVPLPWPSAYLSQDSFLICNSSWVILLARLSSWRFSPLRKCTWVINFPSSLSVNFTWEPQSFACSRILRLRSLLRYEWQTITCTYLKCTVWRVWIFIRLWNHPCNQDNEPIHHTQKFTCIPW